MSCKPDIKTTKEMYALYHKGYSLAQVGKAFGVSRQTVYLRFVRRGCMMRERTSPLPFIMFSGKKYTRRANGYYASTNNHRSFLHRDIWEASNGPIPTGFDVHHKDFYKAHNVLSNLELISKSEHASKYPHRQNQHTRSRYKVIKL